METKDTQCPDCFPFILTKGRKCKKCKGTGIYKMPINKVDGFVICAPMAFTDKMHPALYSFGQTSAEAWLRFIGPPHNSGLESSTMIQHWHNRGYRVKRATITIEDMIQEKTK